jgi:hypothetical protein
MSALIGLAWMHGATVPAGAACVSHETPQAHTSSSSHNEPTPMAAAPTMAVPLVAMPAEVPVLRVESAPTEMGSHLAMVCIAILVGLLTFASAPILRVRSFADLVRHRSLGPRVFRWPPPPDLAQLSVLRT